MLTAKQIEDRRKGIGGSDIAAIAGIHPYRSALNVYMDKLGIETINEVAPRNEEAIWWGNRLEDILALRYQQDTGAVLLRPKDVIVHATLPWARALPDRLVRIGKERGGWEGKTAGFRQSPRWGAEGDEVPEEYLLQTAWYCAVTDRPWWDLSVLLGGQDWRTFRLPRDTDLEKRLLEIGAQFWEQCVVAQKPPAPDGSNEARLALAELYPRDLRPELLPATDKMEYQAEVLKVVRGLLATYEGQKTKAENMLKSLIGDATGIRLESGEKIMWKATKGREVTNWKAVAEDLYERCVKIDGVGWKLEEVADHYTETKPGVRRFLVPRAWTSNGGTQ